MTEFARVQSTFAGHYDLAAYLVLVLPVLFAVLLKTKNHLIQAGLVIVQLNGIWLMAVGASKSSFLAYAVAMGVVIWLLFKNLEYLKRRSKWIGVGLSGSFLTALAMMIIFFGGDTVASLQRIYSNLRHPVQSTSQPATKPSDLYYDAPGVERVATTSAEGEKIVVEIEKENTWSANAIKYGLSMGIRLDTLWPQALTGLVRNPLSGIGYATLSKERDAQFTEADSTDNNFLRVLGETGLLGFVTFFGLIWYLVKISLSLSKSKSPWSQAVGIGFAGGCLGLLVNALYLDVFVASKVAFTFWALAGIVTKLYYLDQGQQAVQADQTLLNRTVNFVKRHWLILAAMLCLFFQVHKQPFYDFGQLRSLDPQPAATQNLTTLRCLIRDYRWELCRVQAGPTATSHASLSYVLLLWPFYLLVNDPNTFYFVNLILALGSLWWFNKLVSKLSREMFIKLIALTLYVMMPLMSRLPAMPVPENLLLPVMLMLSWRLFIPKTQRNRLIIGLLLVTGLLSLPSNIDNLLYLIWPLILLAALWLLKRFEVKLRFTQNLKTVIVLLIAGYFTWQMAAGAAGQQILHNFRNDLTYWRYHTVRRINSHMAENKNYDHSFANTALVTAVNPYYFDLYSNGSYELLPLSKNQAFFTGRPELVWGEHDYINLIDLYSQQLSADRQVFATNFDLTDQLLPSWQEMRNNFDLEVQSFGCNYECNLYRVMMPKTLEFALPTTLNNRSLDATQLRDSYSLVVYSHRFSPVKEPARYNTLDFLPKINQVSQLKPDFLVLMGDPVSKSESGHAQLFKDGFADLVEYPILYLAGNYDLLPEKVFDGTYQGLRTESELFLFLNPGADGSISDQQKIFIINSLEKARKDPSLKNTFVFNHRLSWLADNAALADLVRRTNQGTISQSEGDSFFSGQVMPFLRSMTDKQIYMISGDIKTDQSAGFLTRADASPHLSYWAVADNGQRLDSYLKVDVNHGQVELNMEFVHPENVNPK